MNKRRLSERKTTGSGRRQTSHGYEGPGFSALDERKLLNDEVKDIKTATSVMRMLAIINIIPVFLSARSPSKPDIA